MNLLSRFRRLLPAQKALVVILAVLWTVFLLEGELNDPIELRHLKYI